MNSINRMYVIMLLVPLFWGGSFATAEHIITEIPPITAATIRFGLAGFILIGIVFMKSEWNTSLLLQNWKGLLFVSLTGIFGYNVFFFMGLHYTSTMNGSLIIATMPVFVTLGAILFFKESWSLKIGISLILSLIGVIVVITSGSVHKLMSLSFNNGDLLFIAALICGVLYSLTGKKVMHGVSPLLTTMSMTVLGTVFLAGLSLYEDGWGKVITLSLQGWIEMLYMVICGTLIGYIVFNKGVEELGASKASMYLNLTPIVATGISVVLYGAIVTWQQIVGMIIVLIGVYIATIQSNKDIKKFSHNQCVSK
ncbi:EamA family transporter [Bacillus fungorum]|uniref:EamA family transporter n=1 Tax=Bacillus fungorum TaxID=2039284 RepID=A0A2G6QEP4_9BACI|nr:DMT family transporter [Bacillus fungorum]PIE95312.1 EamA family transporter [Bacillus fungorum]